MPKPERATRLRDAPGGGAERDSEYTYRRNLSFGELLPAIGIGIGAGLFAFYVTRLLLQRTPLGPGERAPRLRRDVVRDRPTD